MALEQAVELGPVASRQARRLRHVAARHAEDAHEIVALERAPRLVERRGAGSVLGVSVKFTPL